MNRFHQVEVIDLVNDGSGLGFGIVGGRSTGVIIKSILPGGIADRDRRLQSGDHILQIGDVHLCGLGSDQVASVLRQTGAQVRMVVARPIEPSSITLHTCSAPIVPTKALANPEELHRHIQNGYELAYDLDPTTATHLDLDDIINEADAAAAYDTVTVNVINCLNEHSPVSETRAASIRATDEEEEELEEPPPLPPSPETERLVVTVAKSECGLGITVAGYVCEREDLSGIFVKSISVGGEAHKCGQIRVNDHIVAVDGQPLHDCTNHQAVERLKQTGHSVTLTLERYLRGPKFEHLQEALASQQDRKDLSPPSPSATTLSWIPIDAETVVEHEADSIRSVNSEIYENNPEHVEVFVDEVFEGEAHADAELAVKEKWEGVCGAHAQIVVAHINKLKGLGISLEGTVEVEGGVELRPRHFIRSILPDGPVGQHGRLSSGDELLEVNGQRLRGLRHVEVVKILKSLPHTVRLVCARKREENRVINTSQDREAFEARNILGGSLKNLLPQADQKLLKALSDSSINTSSTATITDEGGGGGGGGCGGLSKAKSRSLEHTNLAMWSEAVEYVELIKGERGLGFSILDYQDPLDARATVIVIRSLVPGGPAECDGRLKAGDRLISVNAKIIKNATLDQAVQALKGTSIGAVKIGVAKPLSSKMSESQSSDALS